MTISRLTPAVANLRQFFTPRELNTLTQDTFTEIPPWAKLIHVMYKDLSTNSTSICGLRAGTSAGIDTSSYVMGINQDNGVNVLTSSTRFRLTANQAAAGIYQGSGTLILYDPANNVWMWFGSCARTDSGNSGHNGNGYVALPGILDRLQLEMENGTDTFDGGSWNILVEG